MAKDVCGGWDVQRCLCQVIPVNSATRDCLYLRFQELHSTAAEHRSTSCPEITVLMQGLILRPRFSRGGHVFEVPVMLSPSVQQDTNLVIAAYVVPPLLTFITKYYVVLPLQKRSKVKKVLPRCPPLPTNHPRLLAVSSLASYLEGTVDLQLQNDLQRAGRWMRYNAVSIKE